MSKITTRKLKFLFTSFSRFRFDFLYFFWRHDFKTINHSTNSFEPLHTEQKFCAHGSDAISRQILNSIIHQRKRFYREQINFQMTWVKSNQRNFLASLVDLTQIKYSWSYLWCICASLGQQGLRVKILLDSTNSLSPNSSNI